MHDIKDSVLNISKRIAEAQSKSRFQQQVKLLAVTKTHPFELLQQAYACGVKYFGENRVQELLAKQPLLPGDIQWHLIGPLQTNKVKMVLPNVTLIHSLDRQSLADELEKRGAEKNLEVKALLEVNVAQEESKHGLMISEVKDFIDYVISKKQIKVLGLMTVAPQTNEPEEVRWVFRKLRLLFDDIQKLNLPNVSMNWLSMGMTNDFEVAIEEGANLVRIGSGIFGKR